jgi:hypothetical protein
MYYKNTKWGLVPNYVTPHESEGWSGDAAPQFLNFHDYVIFIGQLRAPAALLLRQLPLATIEHDITWAPEAVWSLWRKYEAISIGNGTPILVSSAL